MMLAQVPAFLLEAASWCAALTALGVFVAGVWRIPLIQRLWHRNVTEPRTERLEEAVGRVVAPILAELQPNGGSSARDVVDRVEHRQAVTDKRLARLEDHLGIDEAAG